MSLLEVLNGRLDSDQWITEHLKKFGLIAGCTGRDCCPSLFMRFSGFRVPTTESKHVVPNDP